MELGLKGRVAVITGPAKGMGAAVSKAFAAEGCKLALIGRDVSAIEPVAKEIRDAKGEAIVVQCDVTNSGACESAAEAAKNAFGGRIDILVYVAAGMVDGPRFREKVCADMAKKLNITVEEAAQRHAAEYALRRVTTDHDVANACLFFASDVSRQITGADIPVDGGWAAL